MMPLMFPLCPVMSTHLFCTNTYIFLHGDLVIWKENSSSLKLLLTRSVNCHGSWFLERHIFVFKCVSWSFEDLIILDKSIQLISPKLGKSQPNNVAGWTALQVQCRCFFACSLPCSQSFTDIFLFLLHQKLKKVDPGYLFFDGTLTYKRKRNRATTVQFVSL